MTIELEPMPQNEEPPPEQGQHLAYLLGAIEDLKREKIEYLADWKAPLENLQTAVSKVAREILTGQLPLIDSIQPRAPEETKQ
jgi:hypothetical protein